MGIRFKKGHSNKQSVLIAVTLIVLAIAGIVLFYYFRNQYYGRVSRENLCALAGGLEKYVAKNHIFPSDIKELSQYGVLPRAFHSPYDTPGKISYGINAAVVNKDSVDVVPDEIVIAESKSPVFSSYKDFEYRRKNGLDRYAYVVLRNKTVFLYKDVDQKVIGQASDKNGSAQGCGNEYNQKLNRCRALKMDDSYFSQCPSDALNQYNHCITR